ncbi:MAG: O-antigen ligase family protein [Solirubrobacterales bacterium]
MRQALRTAAAVVLLAGPAVLAFRSGGYFAEPRLAAGVGAWLLAAIGLAAGSGPLLRSAPVRTAAGGLAALTALVGLSILWAPIAATAQADLQRLLLYLGALVAGIALLRGRMGLRTVEPALGAGVLLVIVYALSDRLLPGLVSQEASRSAAGRLEQPLTYWNAMGALAAVGLVIALRVAGDGTRERWLALAGAAAAVPLAVGVYLSFSRGALLALLLGVLVLVVGSADRTQLRVIGSSAVAGVLACVAAGLLPAVRALEGAQSSRELQGAVMLLVLVALMSASAFAAARLRSAAAAGSFRVPAVAAGALAVVLVGGLLVVASGSGSQDGQPRVGADTRRLASFESNRYEYWKVAGGMFVGHPLAGEGSGSFRVVWRRDRKIDDPALDAHSLPVETAAELGLLGLLALAAFTGGAGWAVVRLLRRRRTEAVGAAAALSVLALHSTVDWDWEMPALALIGVLLIAAVAGALDDLQEG